MVPKAYLWNCKNVKLTLAIALQTKGLFIYYVRIKWLVGGMAKFLLFLAREGKQVVQDFPDKENLRKKPAKSQYAVNAQGSTIS